MLKNLMLMIALAFSGVAINEASAQNYGGGYGPGYGGGYGPGYGSGQYGRSCVAGIETRRGRIIQRFRAPRCRGPQSAMRQCRRELERRQYNGQNPYARCVILRRPGNGGGYDPYPGGGYDPTPMARCSVDRVGRSGVVRQSYMRRARTRRIACDAAVMACSRDRVRQQRCVIRR